MHSRDSSKILTKALATIIAIILINLLVPITTATLEKGRKPSLEVIELTHTIRANSLGTGYAEALRKGVLDVDIDVVFYPGSTLRSLIMDRDRNPYYGYDIYWRVDVQNPWAVNMPGVPLAEVYEYIYVN